MTETLKALLLDQFQASLSMLEECVASCPDEHWEGRIGKAAYWRVVYHTLFFVDMYLSVDESSFQPRSFHRKGIHSLDVDGSSAESEEASATVFSKEMLLEYLAHCRGKFQETIAAESQASLEKLSGFPWYPMSRGEHHLTSIRHIQHHVGQLSAYLVRNVGINVEWIGKLK